MSIICAADFIDLSHTLMPDVPNWDGCCGFERKILCNCDQNAPSNETTFAVHELKMFAGIGTHVDSPSHCFPGKAHIADLGLQDLISPCAVVDVSSRVVDATYVISMEDVSQFEREHESICKGCFVIFRTGWEKFWIDGALYRNNLQFPSISEEVALYMVEKDVSGIGIDTLSPDCDGSGFPVHRIILGAGKYIVENLSNVAAVPPTGSTIMVMPIKVHECSEAPARVIVGLPAARP